jgi:hypothetical protein
MDTNGAPKIIVSLCQLVHLVKLFDGGANAQSTRDMCVLHFLANVWQLRNQLRK